MKKSIWKAGMALFLLAVSCQDKAEQTAHESEETAAEAAEAGVGHVNDVHLDTASARAAGIVCRTVEAGTFRDVILTSGRLLPATGDEATLVAGVTGIVSLARDFTEGSPVAKGGTAFIIATDRLQDGDPVEKARVAFETARGEYERGKRLVQDKIITQKDFATLRADYETARIAYEAMTSGHARGGTAVKSPLSGYVKSLLVREGDYVTAGQPLMTVTQQRRLHLRADVPERYYPQIAGIVSARFRTAYSERVYDLQELKGRLVARGRTVSDSSPYVPVTFEFDNRGDLLPGAYLEVYLLGKERQDVVSIPLTALTEDQGTRYVYVQEAADVYVKREVETGASDGCNVEILRGLRPGERVAVEGATHLKLASAKSVIPAHTHNH